MMQKEPYKIIGGVYLVLTQNDTVLLMLRQNTGFGDGFYSLVSGHLEANESITNATIREAQEEIGIIINPEDLEFASVMHRNAPKGGIGRVNYFMKPKKWYNTIKNMEPEKCKELKFFNIKELPTNIIPHVKVGIDLSLKGIKFIEFGGDD